MILGMQDFDLAQIYTLLPKFRFNFVQILLKSYTKIAQKILLGGCGCLQDDNQVRATTKGHAKKQCYPYPTSRVFTFMKLGNFSRKFQDF